MDFAIYDSLNGIRITATTFLINFLKVEIQILEPMYYAIIP